LCGISKDKASIGASKHFILRNAWCGFILFIFNYTQWVPNLYLLDITRIFLKIKLITISTLNNALKVGKFQKQMPLGSISSRHLLLELPHSLGITLL